MPRILSYIVITLVLLTGAASAQTFTLPELGLQSSGTCPKFAVKDRGSKTNVALGCLDTASKSWTLTPGRMTVRHPNSPPQTGDYGTLVVQNSDVTASDIISPQMPPGHYKGENIRSSMVVPAGTTTGTNSAFGFYVRNDSVADAVGVFGTTVCNRNGGSCWALNPTVIDHTANGVDTSAFNFGRILVGSELDVQVTSRDTTVSGYNCTGSSGVQPKGSVCFQVGHLLAADPSRGIKWTYGLSVDDGTASAGISVGAADVSGANKPGMPILMNYRDSAGLIRAISIAPTGDARLAVGGPAFNNGVLVGPAVAGQFPTISSYGSDADPGLVLRAQGAGQVITQSMLNANQGLFVAGSATFAQPIKLPEYTVATLPTCNASTRSQMAAVVDAASPTYRGALTGGGSVRTPVYCDGASWTSH